MAQVQNVYVIRTRDYHLLDRDSKGVVEKDVMVFFDKEDARQAFKYLVERSVFELDPISFNRETNQYGNSVVYTSTDPKRDGQSYNIWYEEAQMVLI